MSINHAFFVPHPPIIIPDIGRGQEKIVQNTINAYHEICKKIAEIKPETIIISSPHSTVYSDYFHISPGSSAKGDMGQFGARNIKYEVGYDVPLRNMIEAKIEKSGLPGGTFGERSQTLDHGAILPLYFITQYYSEFKVVRISPSGLSLSEHYQVGQIINSIIAEDKNVVWVASGDLSHKLKKDGPYGLAKEGKEFDDIFTDAVKTKDFLKIFRLKPEFCHKAAECGLGSFMMMAGIFDGYDIESELLSYEGSFGVGYAVAAFTRKSENKNREFLRLFSKDSLQEIEQKRSLEDEYVRLARASLEYYIKTKSVMAIPDGLDEKLLKEKAGVFVSLHKNGRLRGCIGTIYPVTMCIAEEIISNAVSAGTRDYRFPSVKPLELGSLEYSVDVLGKPEPIQSTDELDIKRYGVIVRHNHKTGLLLPNIDGINDVYEQVDIAKRKAGIGEKEEYTMERFEVIRHY